ncbi:MAG TPA: protein kinase, partial [Candidatus Sulfotelmatobacter sp.]|nr:protein kinase [Candidatus Sulfotelmatobacter sp.]
MLGGKPENSSESSVSNAATVGVASSSGTSGSDGATVAVGVPAGPALSEHQILGSRYEILKKLGEGGMGAVYKAKDIVVDRLVALKVIRPDLAANRDILQRFKQELILARQITHKNVVRIYDMSEAEGVKFITMEYVDGEDLRSILRKSGKRTPPEAVSIMQQICRALDACHAEGVIHRDLKPGNVMRDKAGKVLIMDFGLAHSAQTGGLTQTGMLLGTLEYMSPEQAQGRELGPPSDIYAAGLIFYELLTGKSPFEAKSAVESLVKRSHERATPVNVIEKTVPRDLSNVVSRCIEPNPANRYQSVAELLADLEAYQPSAPTVATRLIRRPAARTPLYKYAVVALGALVLAAFTVALFRNWIWAPVAAQHAPVGILVSDFDNQTAESVFDETLEPAFTVAMEGASFINSYSRGQAHKIAAKLQPGSTRLNEQLARLVATREGINIVITGSISKNGDSYRLNIHALDAVTGKDLNRESENVTKQDVLVAMGKLAAGVRKALGDETPESAQLAAAETYTTQSLEAAHAYAVGQDLMLAGKWHDAINAYQRAINLDPNLGRAYSGMAVIYANTGKRQEAEKYYSIALAHIDRMTDREKYRTRSGYYLLTRNQTKAIEELNALVSQFPADSSGHANLALAYFYARNMNRAQEEQKLALAVTPHSQLQRVNFAMYALYAGDFDTAARESKALLDENPTFDQALRTAALAALGLGHNDEARQDYEKAKEVGTYGASIAATGLSDLALYEGRTADAKGILEQAITADLAAKDAESAADRTATLAQAELALGKIPEAVSSTNRIASASTDAGVLYRSAQVYLAAGQQAKALQTVEPLTQRLETEPQIYPKLIAAEALIKKGKPRDAVQSLQEAQKLADTWLGHFDLGRAYLDAGAYTEASSEFDACLKRRGEVTSVFLDDVQSYHLLPAVYYYQGRAQEGLKSPGAADSYKAYLAIKEKGAGDPLVADATKRLAA